MSPIRCYLLNETNFYRLSLRRYHSSHRPNLPENKCPLPHGYHDASTVIEAKLECAEAPCSGSNFEKFPKSDSRWPTKCACGYEFVDSDEWDANYDPLYQRADTQEFLTISEAPVGALWDATWMPFDYKRSDGRYMMCRTPGGDWAIDSKCSNCTRPNEPHECWVRHGVPPDLHVDKNGNTCSAGAGSIITGGWHGFLHHGQLVTC